MSKISSTNVNGNLTVDSTVTTDDLVVENSAKIYDSLTVEGKSTNVEVTSNRISMKYDVDGNQGVDIAYEFVDSSLPEPGYGIVVKKSHDNTQNSKAQLVVEGNIYANGDQKVYHEGNKPSLDDIGLSNVNNFGISDEVDLDSSDSYASSKAVHDVNEKVDNLLDNVDEIKFNANNSDHASIKLAKSESGASVMEFNVGDDNADHFKWGFTTSNGTPFKDGMTLTNDNSDGTVLDVKGTVSAEDFILDGVNLEDKMIERFSDSSIVFEPTTDGLLYRGVCTGRIRIVMPYLWTSAMITFKVNIFDYTDTNSSFTYTISGYTHSTGWHAASARCDSYHRYGNIPVVFGNTTDNTVILIGVDTTGWSNIGVSITDVTVCNITASNNKWNKGWNVTVLQDNSDVVVGRTIYNTLPNHHKGGVLIKANMDHNSPDTSLRLSSGNNKLEISSNMNDAANHDSIKYNGNTVLHEGNIGDKLTGLDVFHAGNKPTKEDVGLDNLENYGVATEVTDDSSDKYAIASNVKTVYDIAKASADDLDTAKGTANSLSARLEAIEGAMSDMSDGGVETITEVIIARSGHDNLNERLNVIEDSVGLGEGGEATHEHSQYVKLENSSDTIINSHGNIIINANNDLNRGDNITMGSGKNKLKITSNDADVDDEALTYNDYKVYHEGYKPTKEDVGLGNVDNFESSNAIDLDSDEHLATSSAVNKVHEVIKDVDKEVKEGRIDYFGNTHTSLKDAMDANVKNVFNIALNGTSTDTRGGQSITVTDGVEEKVTNGKVYGQTYKNELKVSGKESMSVYDAAKGTYIELEETESNIPINAIIHGDNISNSVLDENGEYVLVNEVSGSEVNIETSVVGDIKSAKVYGQTLVNVMAGGKGEFAVIDSLDGEEGYITHLESDKTGNIPSVSVYGETLVNRVTSVNDGVYTAELKPYTMYTIIADVTLENTYMISGNISVIFSDHVCVFNTGNITREQFITFTNPVNNVMIIEGDMRGLQADFFEGQADVECPRVSISGKNLIDIRDIESGLESAVMVNSNNITFNGDKHHVVRLSPFILETGETYTLSADLEGVTVSLMDYYTGDSIRTLHDDDNEINLVADREVYCVEIGTDSDSIRTVSNIQLELGSTRTTYEMYSATEVYSDVTLRSVNGHSDELSLSDFKDNHIQRVKHVELRGELASGWTFKESISGVATFYREFDILTGEDNIISNRLSTVYSDGLTVYISLDESLLSANSATGLETYLNNEENAYTLSYVMFKPVTDTVDVYTSLSASSELESDTIISGIVNVVNI